MYAFYELKEFMEVYGLKDSKPMNQTSQNETRQNEKEESNNEKDEARTREI